MFAKDKTGAYYGMPGDFATLTELGGTFQLRQQTGAVISFRADGRLDYLQDTNGNRITAEYSGSQMTSLKHSNGSAVTLAYNAQGRISKVTDPAGRIATYDYDVSGEHLVRVTTVAGSTEYSYAPNATGPAHIRWRRLASQGVLTSSSTTTVRVGWRAKSAMVAPSP